MALAGRASSYPPRTPLKDRTSFFSLSFLNIFQRKGIGISSLVAISLAPTNFPEG